jgi:hypothetical protein
LIQVTDRRLTWPDGQVFNDYTNKVTIFNGRMAVSYAGLSKVLGQKTDEWLAQTLANPTIRTLADAVYTLKDRATAAFPRLGAAGRRKGASPSHVSAPSPGRVRRAEKVRGYSSASYRTAMTNTEYCRLTRVLTFACTTGILEPGDFHGFFNIGAALSIEERHRPQREDAQGDGRSMTSPPVS